MKNYVFRLAMTCLSAILVVSTSFAAAGTPTKGNCGDADAPEAVKWEFDINTGTLTITGTGAMLDFDQAGYQPWYVWGDDITTVIIGEGVTRIGNYAFLDFPLTSIQAQKAEAAQTRADGGSEPIASALPEGLTSIGKYALSNTQLNNLTLPSTLQRIDKFALFSNTQLTTLTFLATMSTPELENDVFASCNNLTAIYVPETCVDDYKNAESWATYASLIKAIPEGGDDPGGDDPSVDSGSEVVSVGSVGNANSYLPSYPQSEYSTSQQIYTKDEIGKAGEITSIAFYNYEMGKARSYDIYLSHTTKEEFDSNTDWITVSEANKVFSGTVILGDGWTVIDFDTPFDYDGEQNLLLTVDDNTGNNTGNYHSVGVYSPSGHQALYYYRSTNLDPTQPITVEGDFHTSYSGDRKNGIQLCFETNPKPYKLEAVEVGDVSALVQCSLRGNATAWNLRYRKVVKDGEEEQTWTVVNNLTDRSKTLEGLTPLTKYEAQVQAVFPEDILSEWTTQLVFVTNCCPVEEQAEIIYAVNSNNSPWYGYAIQFVDISDEENPVEVAYINPPSYQFTGGTITLCCGHKYKVNWIYDDEHSNVNGQFSLALYFEPGDEFFSMARGEAPEETAELTEFIMDCTLYCAPKPKNITLTGTTYNSATMTFVSETKQGEVVYSTEEDFDPDAATPASVTFDALSVSNDDFYPEYNPANSSLTLTGLESLTLYYVRVRSVCTEGVGHSRWSDPIRVITNSKFAPPSSVTASPVDSKTEDTAWERNGIEGKNNVNYRTHGAGTPAGAPMFIDLDGDGETFRSGSSAYSSEGKNGVDNVLAVANVPANAMVSWNAADGNSAKAGGNTVRFQYGFVKQTKKYGDSDEEKVAAQAALTGVLQSQKQEEQEAQQNAEKLKELLDQAKQLEKEIEEQSVDGYIPLPLKLKLYKVETQIEAFQQASQTKKAGDISITPDRNTEQSSEARSMTRAPGEEEEYYFFFIRHTEPDEYLLVKDITITPPENIGDWITIPNVKNVEYTLAGLKPNTQYEVMVEPVYDSGAIGIASPITIFTTIGEETDPMEGEFSVSATKKVQFAKGNLRYEGDRYGMEAKWSMAPQQYEIFGEGNVDGSTPASPRDLFCWSNTDTRYGIYNYYSEENTQQYFQGDFTDWGTNSKLLAVLGAGWSTLNKDEWTYLLTERENAATLKAFATVNNVKGLILLPDDWTGGAPAATYTAEAWATMETAGVVFLPAAGQMTAVYNPDTYGATTTYTPSAIYWTSSPVDAATENALDFGSGLTFNETEATIANVSRRTYFAVRLVKALPEPVKGDANGDGIVNAVDIVEMVNAKNGNASVNFKLKNVDFDGNGEITDAEINAVADIILGKAK